MVVMAGSRREQEWQLCGPCWSLGNAKVGFQAQQKIQSGVKKESPTASHRKVSKVP
jgi:hypothetical protein